MTKARSTGKGRRKINEGEKWGETLEKWNQAKHDELQKDISYLLGEITRRIFRIKTYSACSDRQGRQKDMRIMIEDGLEMLRQTQQMLLEIAEFVIQTKKYTMSVIGQDTTIEVSSMHLLNESAVLLQEQSKGLSDLLINMHSPAATEHEDKKYLADSAEGIH